MKIFYWLCIEPYVYISMQNGNVLFYNTLNGSQLEYNDNSTITNLTKRLISKQNSLVIKLSHSDINNDVISIFIEQIKNNFFGDIIKSSNSNSKPFQLKPILNIQKSVERLMKSEDFNVGRKLMLNLNELNIYIHNECGLNCPNCSSYNKQFPFCTKSVKSKMELNLNILRRIIIDLKGTSIKCIRIFGGDLFSYSQIQELDKLLFNYIHIVEYNIHYKNLYYNINNINIINKKSVLNILIDEEIDIDILYLTIKSVENKCFNYRLNFVVDNDNALKIVQKIASEIKNELFIIYPFYNKTNIDFFKKKIFIKKKDILEIKPSMNDIFLHQTLNSNSFGKLYIKYDGRIFSNLNNKEIGNINENTLYDAVYYELENGINWWKLRTNVLPCKKCLYNLLCPPISNYEMIIGKYDLCNLSKIKTI